jgi:hypothetical protein
MFCSIEKFTGLAPKIPLSFWISKVYFCCEIKIPFLWNDYAEITQIFNSETTMQKFLKSVYRLEVITYDENVVNIYQ